MQSSLWPVLLVAVLLQLHMPVVWAQWGVTSTAGAGGSSTRDSSTGVSYTQPLQSVQVAWSPVTRQSSTSIWSYDMPVDVCLQPAQVRPTEVRAFVQNWNSYRSGSWVDPRDTQYGFTEVWFNWNEQSAAYPRRCWRTNFNAGINSVSDKPYTRLWLCDRCCPASGATSSPNACDLQSPSERCCVYSEIFTINTQQPEPDNPQPNYQDQHSGKSGKVVLIVLIVTVCVAALVVVVAATWRSCKSRCRFHRSAAIAYVSAAPSADIAAAEGDTLTGGAPDSAVDFHPNDDGPRAHALADLEPSAARSAGAGGGRAVGAGDARVAGPARGFEQL